MRFRCWRNSPSSCGGPDIAVTIARAPSRAASLLFDASFPVVDLGATGAIERALALAVARQESAFNSAAVSPSGALGLMQLMPGTARDVAGRLGVPFIQDKLTRDPAYNVHLGSQYLAEMLQRFGGSYELALAAYNAGPNRVALAGDGRRSARRQDRHGRLDRDDPVPRDAQLRAAGHGRRRRLSRPPERPVPDDAPSVGRS